VPLQRSVLATVAHFALALEVFEMGQHFEDREMMIDGRKLAAPHLAHHLMRGAGRFDQQIENLVAAFLMMADRLRDPARCPEKGSPWEGRIRSMSSKASAASESRNSASMSRPGCQAILGVMFSKIWSPENSSFRSRE